MKNTMFKSKYGDIYYELSKIDQKPTVIFTHGVGMDHRTFEKQVASLKTDYVYWSGTFPGMVIQP